MPLQVYGQRGDRLPGLHELFGTSGTCRKGGDLEQQIHAASQGEMPRAYRILSARPLPRSRSFRPQRSLRFRRIFGGYEMPCGIIRSQQRGLRDDLSECEEQHPVFGIKL